MQKNKMIVKKEMLQVFLVSDSKKGNSIEWKYGHNIEAYQLIGILEAVKQDLINRLDEE